MPASPSPRKRIGARVHGFTLIEILVAMAIAVILLSLALPAFFDSVRKSRRSEAFAALTAVQQTQERRRANAGAYTTDLPTLQVVSPTPSGYYTLVVDAADATSYTITATAAGAQDKDTLCNRLRVRVTAGNILYGSACKACAMPDPLTDANRCWNRQ